MNPVVKAQLNAFRKDNPSVNLSDSELFEVYSIYAVSNGILSENIDPFDAHLKGEEFGLDGVALLVQGELCQDTDKVSEVYEIGKNHFVEFNLFQSKTSEKTNYGDLSKFFDGAYSFFQDDFVNPTEQLLELQGAKDAIYEGALRRNPNLNLFYVTTGSGEVSDQIKHLVIETEKKLKGLNIFEAVNIQIVGAKDLQAGFRSATNSISESIDILSPITLPQHPSVQQAFLGYVTAKELVTLVTTEIDGSNDRRINRAVFFDNIRDFNEKSDINQRILKDLEDNGRESFIFKNNGVTVVAKEIKRKGDTFELEDFQVINGCQTSNILFLAGDDLDRVNVPFRLIGSSDPDFVATIIVGTNTQNEVKEDQFWALTPFMKDLEEYCREQAPEKRLFLERRENQYRSEAVERTRIFKPSELVKAVAAMFIFQPHRAARDYRGIRKEFGLKLFQSGHNVIPYHAAAYVNYKLDFLIRNKRVERSWGIYKFYVLYTLGKKMSGGNDIFTVRPKEQERICEEIISFALDEDKLLDLFSKVEAEMSQLVKSASIETREKVRDYIRSESVLGQFSRKFDFSA